MIDRRHLLGLAAAALASPAHGERLVDLRLPGGPSQRRLSDGFPGKRGMILQRTVPPLLETPQAVFDGDVFTPNDRFFVRWHWPFPTEIDPAAFRLQIDGHVAAPVSLSLADLQKLPQAEIAAVNQCAGNSRGLFVPRVAGAQWRHGAMGNARWTGVWLKDVLDRAGVRAGAVAVRFSGLDAPPVDDAPDFAKSLALDHARDGEVLLATHMNGAPLPILNGFPLRLVVPGWYSTYWVKMLDRIEVLAAPDAGYWMTKAYLVPASGDGGVAPGLTDYPRRPIGAMVPRSFITNIAAGARLPAAAPLVLRGIAFGGDCGVAGVEVSADDGASWHAATLGPDHGRYSFRRFEAVLAPPAGTVAFSRSATAALPRSGTAILRCRATNTQGRGQPLAPIWNPGGYLRGHAEAVEVDFA